MERLEFSIRDWFRDAQGFRLEDAERLQPHPQTKTEDSGPKTFPFFEGLTFPEGFARLFPIDIDDVPPLRIVRNGGSLVSYQPSNNLNEILRELLNTAPTPEGALEFANRFGPLGRAGFKEGPGEDVKAAIANIKFMNRLVDVWPMRGDNTAIGQILGADGFGLVGVLDTRIIYDQPKKTSRIHVTLQHLNTLLWAHLFELLMSEDTVLRRCEQCNNLFSAGLGTGRRLDAKFCSDEHRALFHNLKRTPSGGRIGASQR